MPDASAMHQSNIVITNFEAYDWLATAAAAAAARVRNSADSHTGGVQTKKLLLLPRSRCQATCTSGAGCAVPRAPSWAPSCAPALCAPALCALALCALALCARGGAQLCAHSRIVVCELVRKVCAQPSECCFASLPVRPHWRIRG